MKGSRCRLNGDGRKLTNVKLEEQVLNSIYE